MSKAKIALATLGASVGTLVSGLLMMAHAQSYLITATDTIPIFTAGATAVKDNGLAVLNVVVPYLAGAFVAFAVILVIWVVAKYFVRHRA